MALLDILIPQIGEGLQEVVVLTLNKKPGDFVRRDELLYSMETDKAVMEVESPYEGVLKEWMAEEGAVLAIGAPVARMDTEEVGAATSPQAGAATETTTEAPGSAVAATQIPPRTRAHCKTLGISDDEMQKIPAPTGKLMPADVDAYVAGTRTTSSPATSPDNAAYTDRPLSQQQRLFVHRLKRSAQTVVPATMKMTVDWDSLSRCVKRLRDGSPQASITGDSPGARPTEFQTFAYCVAQVAKEHPRFRSILSSDESARVYDHVNLGIAVARLNNDLVTAVVPSADALDFPAFIGTAQERIRAARDGDDQASAETQLLLTYMGTFGVVDAIPVLVSPAIAVMFIGSSFELGGRTLVNLVLTFDHRLINGVEAAQFLRAVVEKAESTEALISAA